MRPRRGLLFRSLLLGSCIASSAFADGYDAAVTRAAAARDRAQETHSARDWQEALELFAVAIELNPTKEAAFEFAEAALELGLEGEALDAYARALELGLSGKAEERARAFITAHAHTLGRLVLRGPTGARVYVDERKRAVLPLAAPLSVAPGVRHVHVEATNYRPLEADIRIQADQMTTFEATLLPLAEAALPPVSAPGHATVDGAPRPQPAPGRWAMPVLIGGAGLTLAGAATVIATSIAVNAKRRDLGAVCAELRGDECAAATAGHLNRAQSLGNDILALKGVRGIGIGAALLGAGAMTLSLITLASSDGPSAPRRTAGLTLSGSSLEVTWRGEY
jgi:hypothetical protein